MGYDRGDSFPFDFELNGIPFGSKKIFVGIKKKMWAYVLDDFKTIFLFLEKM